jgi:hypothetical protein
VPLQLPGLGAGPPSPAPVCCPPLLLLLLLPCWGVEGLLLLLPPPALHLGGAWLPVLLLPLPAGVL